MSKIKFANYKRFDDKERTCSLYRHKVWLPSYFPNALTITLPSYYGVIQWAPFADGNSVWVQFLGVISILWLILATLATLFFLACGVFESEPRAFGLFHRFGEKPLPEGFDYNFINEPEYQSVLQDHMDGQDIGDLTELNRLIGEKIKLEGSTSAPKSDIVKIQVEALDTYVKALKEIKK